jgi:hypothetical protein
MFLRCNYSLCSNIDSSLTQIDPGPLYVVYCTACSGRLSVHVGSSGTKTGLTPNACFSHGINTVYLYSLVFYVGVVKSTHQYYVIF